jgi:hypothetical protein
MVRWGLRWIFCWLSVLVTACSQLAAPTPAEKPPNRTPLQGFTPPASASPTLPIRPAYTLTPFGSIRSTQTITPEPPSGVLLQMPTCYESPALSLVCIGWIQNTGDTPLSNVVIDLYLLNLQGQPLLTLQVTPVFTVLFPKSGSPYRGVFRQIPDEEWAVYAELHYKEPQLPLFTLQQAALAVDNINADWRDFSYQVSGKVMNRGDLEVSEVRIVVMIWDDRDMMTGFRVLDVSLAEQALLPDESLEFRVAVAPLNRREGTRISVLSQGFVLN